MGDVIDFKSKLDRKIEVELEKDGQTLIEVAIVSLWEVLGGIDIDKLLAEERINYHLVFLQFSGVCFELLEQELIVVDEDGNVEIEKGIKETLSDAINDIKRNLATNDNTTH